MTNEFDSLFTTFCMSIWIEGGECCTALTDVGNRFGDAFDGWAEPGHDRGEQSHVWVGMIAGDFVDLRQSFIRWQLN